MDFVPVNPKGFRRDLALPYDLTVKAIESAMNDIYQLLAEINVSLTNAGLPSLEEQVRKATLSSLISDLLTAGLAKHSATLVVKTFHNGHPDTIPAGLYPDDAVQEGQEGVEVKVSSKPSAIAFDSHAVWETWHIVFAIQVVGREEILSGAPPETYALAFGLADCLRECFRQEVIPVS